MAAINASTSMTPKRRQGVDAHVAHAFDPGFYVCRIYVDGELEDVVKLVIMP